MSERPIEACSFLCVHEDVVAQVQKNLDDAVATLDAKNAAQDQTITIVLVLAIVGVAGCLALAVLLIVGKRKMK